MKLTSVFVPNAVTPPWVNDALEHAQEHVAKTMQTIVDAHLDAVIILFDLRTRARRVIDIRISPRTLLIARAELIEIPEGIRDALRTPAPAGSFHCLVYAPSREKGSDVYYGLLNGTPLAAGGDA